MHTAARSSGNPARHGLIAAAFLTLVCFLAVAADSAHAETLAAKLTNKEGTVLVSRNGAPFVAVKTGQRLLEGDMVKTGKDAKATLTLNENSTINMGPESRLEIKQYLFNYETEKRNVVVKGYSGKMRFVVSKIFKASATGGRNVWNDSNFTVQTPTATAGIKGTEFGMVVSSKHTYFAVFNGLIAVNAIGRMFRQEKTTIGAASDIGVLLGVNQATVVKYNAAPKPAFNVTPQQKQNFLFDTMPSFTAKNTGINTIISSQEREYAKEQSDKQETEKIAKDSAEGKKTGDVIDGLIDSGKNVDEAVALSLKAGLDPAVVINTAISNDYASDMVIRGAIRSMGTEIAEVVWAAMNAGAGKKEIIAAVKDAGLTKESLAKVADSVAKYDTTSGDTAGGETVLGFTAPAEPVTTDVVYVASDSYTVSGGGGAEPSTATASPAAP